jgi:hypothetical protein
LGSEEVQVSLREPLEFDQPPFRHSGTLLYLFQSSSSRCGLSIMPIWVPRTATLNNDHIRLTWSTVQDNPSVHNISLSSIVDVRSVALHELVPGEKALLPSQGQFKNAKVFEISFTDRPVEKFAAVSVPDRVGWVSAIWYVISSRTTRIRYSGIKSRHTQGRYSCRSRAQGAGKDINDGIWKRSENAAQGHDKMSSCLFHFRF